MHTGLKLVAVVEATKDVAAAATEWATTLHLFLNAIQIVSYVPFFID